jgi:hypothetical protein
MMPSLSFVQRCVVENVTLRLVRAAREPGPLPRAVWVVWALANILGGILVAVPDTGPRLFSLSRTHGLSTLDAIGVALIVVGWIALDSAVFVHRHQLRRVSRAARIAAALGLGVGIAILVPTVALDLGAWWVLSVALLTGVQIWAAAVVVRGA